MPEFKGKIEGMALNVPVPNGSLLDLTTVMEQKITVQDINDAMRKAEKSLPNIMEVVDDPIVSTDVVDNTHSLVFDTKATMISPGRMVKTLTWFHSAYAMAARIKDLILAYNEADMKGGSK